MANSRRNLGDITLLARMRRRRAPDAEASGDTGLLGIALYRLAINTDGSERQVLWQRAVDLLEQVGNRRGLAGAHMDAAFAAIGDGRPTDALRLLDVARANSGAGLAPRTNMLLLGNIGLANVMLANWSARETRLWTAAGVRRPGLSLRRRRSDRRPRRGLRRA